jgi:hypothetical protein
MSQPAAESMTWSILVRGKSSFGQHLFRLVKFVHIHYFPFFLWTITTLASHCRYLTSLMNLASNSHCISAFTASTFSSDILRSFCFMGFTCGLTCNLCSITSLLTPTKSKVDQEKISLFLSRNCKSSACSSGLILAPLQMVLSSILGSSATLLKSLSALVAFLNSVEISYLGKGCVCSWWSASSLKKCMFLCPMVKLHSMLLASFLLPNTFITPKVARTLRQRYPECRAASKVFNRPHPNMLL